MSACAECGGVPVTCTVCDLPIDGECRGNDSACQDGGVRCDGCAEYAHTQCYDNAARVCKRCSGDDVRDSLQRDDNAERVRDMNAMLRGGRFYR